MAEVIRHEWHNGVGQSGRGGDAGVYYDSNPCMFLFMVLKETRAAYHSCHLTRALTRI